MRVLFNYVILLLFHLPNVLANEKNLSKEIETFNEMMERHFATENSTSIEQWQDALPTKSEIEDMKKLITYLYGLDNFTSVKPAMLNNYPALENWLNITIVKDVLLVHERVPLDGSPFPRYWGYVALRSRQTTLRAHHHSAAHFESDGPVCRQAAVLFQTTKGRSLVVAGASRYAVKGNHTSPCQSAFQVADAAHNNRTMFHVINVILGDLAKSEMLDKNAEDGHFFVQWHGMAETSCSASDIFISTGIGNSSVYDRDIPATKLASTFSRLFPRMRASTPRDDPVCRLTAGSNLFGRHLNGVEDNRICTGIAKEKDITGRFVHIEQKAAARLALNLWTTVIEVAYPVPNGQAQNSLLLVAIVILSFIGIHGYIAGA